MQPHVVHKYTIVPYGASQMYVLVNDVAKYAEFVPWCVSSEVLLRQWVSTRNECIENKQINMSLVEGPFHHLHGCWRFEDLAQGQSKVSLDMRFTFSSGALAHVFSYVFIQVSDQLITTFEQRAQQIYGPPA